MLTSLSQISTVSIDGSSVHTGSGSISNKGTCPHLKVGSICHWILLSWSHVCPSILYSPFSLSLYFGSLFSHFSRPLSSFLFSPIRRFFWAPFSPSSIRLFLRDHELLSSVSYSSSPSFGGFCLPSLSFPAFFNCLHFLLFSSRTIPFHLFYYLAWPLLLMYSSKCLFHSFVYLSIFMSPFCWERTVLGRGRYSPHPCSHSLNQKTGSHISPHPLKNRGPFWS